MNLIRWALGIDADIRNFDRRYTDLGTLILALTRKCDDLEERMAQRQGDLEELNERAGLSVDRLASAQKTLLETRRRRAEKKQEQTTDG